MTMTTKVSATGTVEIPKSIREAQGLSAGTELEVIARDGEIVLRGTSASAEAKALYPPITIEEFLERRVKVSRAYPTDEEMEDLFVKEANRRFCDETRR